MRGPRSSRSVSRRFESMISTATRDLPKTTVWRPARRNGSAQRCGERQRRAPRPGRRVDDRRVHQQQVLLAGRRAVAVDQPDGAADERLGELGRVPDRGRAAHDHGVAAVVGAQPQEPPQHVGDVGAEHAAVRVQLVDDDDPQLLEQLEPLGVVGEDRRVEHVRVRHHDLPGLADRRADRRGRVAVVAGRRDLEAGVPDELRRTPPPGPGRAPWWGTGTAPGPTGPPRAPGGRAAV